jgi:multidrug efflux pump subunit AcrA (membrane-fusion protein)
MPNRSASENSTSPAGGALAQAKSDLARAEALFAANAMTRPELDAAIANVDVNQARLERGRAAAGEAGLALRDATLVAPINGGVSRRNIERRNIERRNIERRNIERGDFGQLGATAFVLADTGAVKVRSVHPTR